MSSDIEEPDMIFRILSKYNTFDFLVWDHQ